MNAGETTIRTREAQEFLDGVASALVDLPEDDRTDLLDELAAHLDELAAEGDVPLAARLGTPREYADELRASAGLPAAGAGGRNLAERLARVQQLRRRADVAAVERFLVTLRPFWWVLRAWVCVAMLTWFAQPHWSREIAFVPNLGHVVLSVAVLLAAVVLSVQLGRRGRLRTPTARRLLAALNLAVAASLWLVVLMVNEAVMYGTSGYYYGEQVRTVRAVPPTGVYAGGDHVRNIYAYDSQGQMLHDVRLYDQSGDPIDLGLEGDPNLRPTFEVSGRRADNAYPYRYVEPGTDVVADENAGPAIVVPPLVSAALLASQSPSATPSSAASSTPSSSPSPKASKR